MLINEFYVIRRYFSRVLVLHSRINERRLYPLNLAYVRGFMNMKDGKKLLADFLKAGELHILAGVKDVGKTELLLNIAEEYQQNDVEEQILYYYAAPNGEISLPDKSKISKREISELPLQTGHLFLDAKWAKEDGGLSAILIDDYRFLLRTEFFRKNNLSREEKTLFLLTRLKTLAEAYDVPVILSTSVDDDFIWGRKDRMPRISDIPDYEYVEVVADRLIFLHREDLFTIDSEKKGIAELKLFEVATGRCIDYQLAYFPEYKKFCELCK